MKIAYTIAPGRGDTDLLLARLAERLLAAGVRTIGAVQINEDNPDCHRCDMDLKVLPDGPIFRISQSLGKDSRGCRLDPEALEQAVSRVGTGMAGGADILIINKFGKHEAGGRGFRETIAEALSRDIPVLVGLNALNEPAFTEFTGGLAKQVEAETEAVWQWAVAATRAKVATT
jgi:nucleoside-triphosphatase THEP1